MPREHPDAESWSTAHGLGTCFHSALSRWAQFNRERDHGWKIAVGVFKANGERSIHAWLERGNSVTSAVTGQLFDKEQFYAVLEIEKDTVRLVNPRKILRAHRINRASVAELLRQWGGRYRINPAGGVVAD